MTKIQQEYVTAPIDPIRGYTKTLKEVRWAPSQVSLTEKITDFFSSIESRFTKDMQGDASRPWDSLPPLDFGALKPLPTQEVKPALIQEVQDFAVYMQKEERNFTVNIPPSSLPLEVEVGFPSVDWETVYLVTCCALLTLKVTSSIWKKASPFLKRNGYSAWMHPTEKRKEKVLTRFRCIAKRAVVQKRYKMMQPSVFKTRRG